MRAGRAFGYATRMYGVSRTGKTVRGAQATKTGRGEPMVALRNARPPTKGFCLSLYRRGYMLRPASPAIE